MPDIFANDLFEIYGTNIQISHIKDYRLGQIEFIQRPLYFETSKSRWTTNGKIVFGRMDYYAAIIGEEKYKTAIEEASAANVFDALIKTAGVGIANAFSRKGKNVRYRIMNPAWRVSIRSLKEIPALLCRSDGKTSEVYAKDDLYPLLGEPIAPSIVMVPALYITSTDGNYVFFGNGIQVEDASAEHERLKQAIQEFKELKSQKKKDGGKILQNVFGGRISKPKIEIPFIKPLQKKELLESGSATSNDKEHTDSFPKE